MGGKTLRNFIELNAPRGEKETSRIRIRRTGNSNNFVRNGGPSLFAWIKLSSDKETERHTPSFKKRYKTIMNSTSVVWFKGQSYRLWNNLWGKFWSHEVKILFESFTLGWGSKGLPHVCDGCLRGIKFGIIRHGDLCFLCRTKIYTLYLFENGASPRFPIRRDVNSRAECSSFKSPK